MAYPVALHFRIRREGWVSGQLRKICAIEPSGSEPETKERLQKLVSRGVPFDSSSSRKRVTSARTAARWVSSPVNSCGKGMVIEPRAHFALMREPLDSVADRYFVWIDCMVFCSCLIEWIET